MCIADDHDNSPESHGDADDAWDEDDDDDDEQERLDIRCFVDRSRSMS